MLTGKSGCGKTVWVENLLNKWKQVTDDEAGKFLKKILWFYGAEQTDLFDRLKKKFGKEHIEFIDGIDEKRLAEARDCIVIMDDLMSEMRNNVAVAELFTKSSHHKTISACILWQSPFPQGKTTREIATNADYQVIFNNERECKQLKVLCQQMESGPKAIEIHAKMHSHFQENIKNWPNIFINFRPSDKLKIKYLINFPFQANKPCMEL